MVCARSPNEWRGFVPLSVRLSDVALVNRHEENAKLFIPFLELRNNLSFFQKLRASLILTFSLSVCLTAATHASSNVHTCTGISGPRLIGGGSQFQSSCPPPPRSAYFVCYSYRFRCLFYSNVSAKWTSQDIPP